jgi:2'-5' RNA ligase
VQAPTYSARVRLFVQVRPSAEAIQHLRDHLPGVRTSNPGQWHVTLAFLGEVDRPDPLYDGLAAAASLHEPFRLSLRGGGSFGPRATWAAVGGAVEALRALAADVEVACRDAGVHLEDRAYRPHLTVGRVDRRLLSSYEGPSWDVREIQLVHSVLGQRAVHTVLRGFPLYQA